MNSMNDQQGPDNDFADEAENAPAQTARPAVPPKEGLMDNRALRNRLVILGGVFLVVVVVAYGTLMRTRSAADQLPEEVKGVRELPPPGQAVNGETALASSPLYAGVLKDVNDQRLDAAEADGRSGMPLADTLGPVQPTPPAATPSAPPERYNPNQLNQADYQRWQQQQMQAAQMREQQMNEYMKSIQAFMKERRDSWAPKGSDMVTYGDGRSTVAEAKPAGAEVMTVSAATAQPAASPQGQQAAPVTLIAAGTMVSAVTFNRINTDLIAPVVATIVSGRYAGAKLIGTPARAGEVAKIDFKTISIPGAGTSLPIQAISLDAQTLEAGVATSVDRKILAKYVLRPLAGAAAAVGEVAKSAGSTTVNVNGATSSTNAELDDRRVRQIMLGAVGEQAAADLSADSLDPTVRVADKTVIGVLFTADVIYTPQNK